MTIPSKPHLLLKWGTLKGWGDLTEANIAVNEKYGDLKLSMSAAMQEMTDRHKEWLCELIDSVASDGGTFQNDWSGDRYTAEEAKKYVMEYRT
jgi:hypothetical protein